MESCLRCGITEEKALLYDAITKEGVKKICRRCSYQESVPFARTKDAEELKGLERKKEVYDRISRAANIDNQKKLNQKSLVLESQEASLKDLVEKNVCKGISKTAKPREDLIRNFHWIIKRQRRIKHMTAKQLGEKIGEIEKVILLAEEGAVPEGYNLIKKIENALEIKLIKDDVYEGLKAQEEKEISFENLAKQEITIGELKKKKKGGFFNFFSSSEDDDLLEDEKSEAKDDSSVSIETDFSEDEKI